MLINEHVTPYGISQEVVENTTLVPPKRNVVAPTSHKTLRDEPKQSVINVEAVNVVDDE